MGYRIGSFNIRDFSRKSVIGAEKGESRKDLDVIASIIRENHYDIIAVQEILHKEALKELLEKISRQYARPNIDKWNKSTDFRPFSKITGETYGYTTKHWEGRWAKPISKFGDLMGEGYAFIWNKDSIKLVDNREGILFEPRIADFGGAGSLVRPPFIGRFMPKNARYEFRLINTHIAHGNPSHKKYNEYIENSDEIIIDTSDSGYRRIEFRNLINNIYADYCSQIFDKTRNDRNSRGLVPYTFLLGDYNLNLSHADGQSSAKLEITDECMLVQSNTSLQVITVNDELTTLKGNLKSQEKETQLKRDPIEKDHLANNYDHFSYDINTLIDHDIADPEVGVIMAFRKYDGMETGTESKYDLYRKKVSDHLPIYLDIDIRNRRNHDMMTGGGLSNDNRYRKAN